MSSLTQKVKDRMRTVATAKMPMDCGFPRRVKSVVMIISVNPTSPGIIPIGRYWIAPAMQ